MFRPLGFVLAWSSAVVVLVRLGPDLAAIDLGSDAGRTCTTWLTWASTHPDEALVALAASLAWLLLAWVAVAFLVVIGAAGAGRGSCWCRRAARVLVPRIVRHGLEAILGLGIAAVTATPALAATTGPTPPIPSLDRAPATAVRLAPLPAVPAPVLAPAATSPTPLPDVDRAPSSPPVDGPAPPRVHDPALAGALPPSDEIVVRRGDCLWNVVQRFLGPTASDADVARTWPQWYAHNRGAVGADPDLLLPGTVLTPPPPTAAVP